MGRWQFFKQLKEIAVKHIKWVRGSEVLIVMGKRVLSKNMYTGH